MRKIKMWEVLITTRVEEARHLTSFPLEPGGIRKQLHLALSSTQLSQKSLIL